MKNLFLIDGATGTGKSDLVKFVNDFWHDTYIVKKYSTRTQREYEKSSDWKLDLEMVTDKEFENKELEYKYTYSGRKYGFRRKDLLNALENYANVFVIVRDSKLINLILSEQPYNTVNKYTKAKYFSDILI